MVTFMARQFLDMLSPSNIPFLNPEVISVTEQTGGRNLRRGFEHFFNDMNVLTQDHLAPLPLQPGLNVAVTPGQVVFRNELIELIQYTPRTASVRPEPILIVPAWIMKYYILDLSPGDSLIRYLVDQGYTVFCISWLNPGIRQREVHLEDYRVTGIMAAITAVGAITGGQKIHAVGYCLGGTLLTITAAAMARDHDDRLASLTLLAAQTDFSEAGELQLFINEAQLAFLDDLMWSQGYLDSSQMAGAFTMLRSANLIWSRLVRRYYLGIEDRPNDLMSWNQDSTRMPYRMHSEYLWHLFQNNDLAEGRFPAGGKPVSASDIDLPFFVLGTETDHIAPWRSVYKVHLLNSGKITFALSSGGHNAGIVSEPGHPNRHFKILERKALGKYRSPDAWLEVAPTVEGSWWPAWVKWLDAHSSQPVPPPKIGNEDKGYKPLCDAPGTYVLQR
jgi:polyhydroxyalkanoate synthase